MSESARRVLAAILAGIDIVESRKLAEVLLQREPLLRDACRLTSDLQLPTPPATVALRGKTH